MVKDLGLLIIKHRKVLALIILIIISSCKVKKTKHLKATTPITIEGSWSLLKINNGELNFRKIGDEVAILLEIEVKSKKFNGSDGCNSYVGQLEKLTDNEIIFADIASTRKACFNTFDAHLYYGTLKKVRFYAVKNNKLTLFN